MWADHTRSRCRGLFLVIDVDDASAVFVDTHNDTNTDVDTDVVLTETICT